MRLVPSDPDIETIINRIRNDDIDLQPNFQRGEVWSLGKKQKLIDSILRDWHVPPIHVIEDKSTGRSEVLDGQQRLAAIRDFANGAFPVDAQIEPIAAELQPLNGKRYAELSSDWRRKFNKFSIRMFSIVDFKPSEPSELFYRLNQPVALTSAEQRNAFYGTPREQVKLLVNSMTTLGLEKSVLGFSNSRMAYDDVLARLCFLLDSESLTVKVSAQALADRYRTGNAFSDRVIDTVEGALKLFSSNIQDFEWRLSLNKASFLSWLLFISRGYRRAKPFTGKDVTDFLLKFELERTQVPVAGSDVLLDVYNDRVTSRVSDVSSVLYRDMVLWVTWLRYARRQALSIRYTGAVATLANRIAQIDHSSQHDVFTSQLGEAKLDTLSRLVPDWERVP